MKGIWKNISERFFFTKFRQNVAVLTAGNVSVQLISILSYPILTRLYSTEVFGQYALLNSVVLLLSFAISLRYEVAIPLTRDKTSAEFLKKCTIRISLILSLVLFLISIIVVYFNLYPPLNSFIYFIPLISLTSSLLQIYRYWHLKTGALLKYFRILIGYRLIYVALAITLPFTILSLENGLIYSLTLACTIILVVIYFLNKEDFNSNIDIGKAAKILRTYYKFPAFSLPSFFIANITNQLPIFFIASYFNQSIVGQYSVAFSLLFLPQTMLMLRISEALYQNHSVNSLSLKSMVFKIWRWVTLILIGPCLVLYFFGSDIFVFLLGQNWSAAGEISEYFAPLMFIGSISSSTASTFTIWQLQKINLRLSLFRLFYIILAFWLGGINNDIIMAVKIMIFFSVIHQLIFIGIIYFRLNPKKLKVEN